MSVKNGIAYNLVGVDGNAFVVMRYVVSAMKDAGYSREEIDQYLTDAKSSDYDNLLVVSINMIDGINDEFDLEVEDDEDW